MFLSLNQAEKTKRPDNSLPGLKSVPRQPAFSLDSPSANTIASFIQPLVQIIMVEMFKKSAT
jgi:hypothetical protein